MKDPHDANDKERLAWISYLISIGRLDIKVAFTKKLNSKAMFHEKWESFQIVKEHILLLQVQ